jgi:hypothetical protein
VSPNVITFMKASSMVLSSFDSGCSERKPRSGLPGRMMAAPDVVTLLEGIIFGADVG